MNTQLIGNFTRIKDNDMLYFSLLESFLESIDEDGNMLINKTDDKISFRLTPSHPQFLLPLLTAIKEFHTKFNIRVEFAKSIKTSNNISFSIPIMT